MNPDLIAEIKVPLGHHHEYGTGYPIAPGRLITAEHVLKGQKSGLAKFHGLAGEPIAFEVVWNGRQLANVDVAVLKAAFPDGVSALHHLPDAPLREPGKWHSRGFSALSVGFEQPQPSQGPFPACSAGDTWIQLESTTVLPKARDWAGISGEPVFLSEPRSKQGLPIFAGVLTDYVPALVPDNFKAVPMWKLLERQDFKDAIQYDAIRRGEDRLDLVCFEIKRVLGLLSEGAKLVVTAELKRRTGQAHDMETAAKMLIAMDMRELGPLLDKLHREMLDEVDARKLGKVYDLLLPVRFPQDIVRSVAELLESSRGVFVQGKVCQLSVAEILMAGAESRASQFRIVAGEATGENALLLTDPLPTGTGDGGTALAFEWLMHLSRAMSNRARFSIARERCEQIPKTPEGGPDYEQQLRFLGRELNDELASVAAYRDGAHYYCVVERPKGHDIESDGKRKRMANAVAKVNEAAPLLTFIELVQDPGIEERDRPFYHCVHFRLIDKSRR